MISRTKNSSGFSFDNRHRRTTKTCQDFLSYRNGDVDVQTGEERDLMFSMFPHDYTLRFDSHRLECYGEPSAVEQATESNDLTLFKAALLRKIPGKDVHWIGYDDEFAGEYFQEFCGFFCDREIFIKKIGTRFYSRGTRVAGRKDTVVGVFEVGSICGYGDIHPVNYIEFLCMLQGFAYIKQDEFVGKFSEGRNVCNFSAYSANS